MNTNNNLSFNGGFNFDRERGFGRIPNRYNRLGVAPLVAAAAPVFKQVADKLVSFIKGVGTTFEGFSHRKAAAAILALQSKGYTIAQIQQSPLREVVDVVSVWDAPIKDVLQGVPYVNRVMKDAGGEQLFPAPQGTSIPYKRPEDSALAFNIAKQVYGASLLPPGQTEGITAMQIYEMYPPKGSTTLNIQQPQGTSSNQSGILNTLQTAAQTIPTSDGGMVTTQYSAGLQPNDTMPPQTKANIGWVLGLGALAIGAAIYMGQQPKEKS